GLRIVAVGAGYEAVVGPEIVGAPLPDALPPVETALGGLAGGQLPFGRPRQPPPGPAAIGLGLEGVDMDHRQRRVQRRPAVEPALLPLAPRRAAPARRRAGRQFAAPALRLGGPQRRLGIATGLDEAQELP